MYTAFLKNTKYVSRYCRLAWTILRSQTEQSTITFRVLHFHVYLCNACFGNVGGDAFMVADSKKQTMATSPEQRERVSFAQVSAAKKFVSAPGSLAWQLRVENRLELHGYFAVLLFFNSSTLISPYVIHRAICIFASCICTSMPLLAKEHYRPTRYVQWPVEPDGKFIYQDSRHVGSAVKEITRL